MDKFRGKYRIQSTRLQNWDYGSNAMYYITICTRKRKHHFGRIKGAVMNLSDIGKICQQFLYNIPIHFPYIKLDEMVIMPNHIHGIFIIENNNISNCDMIDGTLVGNDFAGDEITGNNPLGHKSIWNEMTENDQFGNNIFGINLVGNEPFENDSAEYDPLGHNSADYDPFVETPKLGVSTDENPSSNPTINPKRRQTINASQKWKSGTIGVVLNQFKRAVTIDARKINTGFGWQSRYYDHIIRNDADYCRIKKYIINNPKNWNEDEFNKT